MTWKIFTIRVDLDGNSKELESFYEGTLIEAFAKACIDTDGFDGIVELSFMNYDQ